MGRMKKAEARLNSTLASGIGYPNQRSMDRWWHPSAHNPLGSAMVPYLDEISLVIDKGYIVLPRKVDLLEERPPNVAMQ